MYKLRLVLLISAASVATNVATRDITDAGTDERQNNVNSIDMVKLLESLNKHTGSKSAKSTQESRRPSAIRSYSKQEVLRERLSSDSESSSYDGQCGKPFTPAVSSFVIGGVDAEAGDWPWQIMLLLDYGYGDFYFNCGGSLISDKWVLTAAHCISSNDIAQVALGAENQDLSGSHVKIHAVEQILCHEEYYFPNNDICLLKLATPVTFNNYIRPICLPSEDDSVTDGEKCVITGWGDTQGTGNDTVLQEVEAEVYPSSNCSDWYAEDFLPISDSHVCAGSLDASAGACYGDSGGPLACKRNDAGEVFYALFGITSFGSPGCLTERRPSVFTRVSSYLDWIHDTQENSLALSMLCYNTSMIHPCGTMITTNNTIIRSPVQDNGSWLYPENFDCWWEVEAPTGYALKFEFLCFLSLHWCCSDTLTISPEKERAFEYSSYSYDRPDSFQTLTSRKANISFHSDSYGEGLGFVIKVSFVMPDIYDGECGVASEISSASTTVFPFISGGTYVSPKKWPWQAQVYQYDEFQGYYSKRCSGTLINEQWILSSASCFNKKSPGLYTVRLGDSTAQEFYADKLLAVGQVHCHEEYDETRAENNICLAKLSTNVTFSRFIRPACVPTGDELVENGVSCTITGYGDWWWSNAELLEAEVEVYEREECSNSYKEDGIFVTDDNFCAGSKNEYISPAPCKGDFGGPLVCKFAGSSSFKIMGVANFAGEYCWYNDNPAVFSEVSRYSDWIETTMANSPDISSCFDPSSIRDCNSSITTDNTIIRSPVTDQETWQYSSDEDCKWYVKSPMDTRIKIEFLCFFNTESTTAASFCVDDYLSIVESTTGARYCGLHDVDDMRDYVTTGNEVELHFHSNYWSSSQGFVLRISFVGTDGDIDQSEGRAEAVTSKMSETSGGENWKSTKALELSDHISQAATNALSIDSNSTPSHEYDATASSTPGIVDEQEKTTSSSTKMPTDGRLAVSSSETATNTLPEHSANMTNSDENVTSAPKPRDTNGKEVTTTSSGKQLGNGFMTLLWCFVATAIVLSM